MDRDKVLKEFREQQCFEPWDDNIPQIYRLNDECPVMRYDNLKQETKLYKYILKDIIKELRRESLIELTTSVNADGMCSGSGYVLTSRGLDYINQHYPYAPNERDPKLAPGPLV
jgi:hypothetical protein